MRRTGTWPPSRTTSRNLLPLLLFITSLPLARATQSNPAPAAEPKTAGIVYLLDVQLNQVSLEYKTITSQALTTLIDGDHSNIRYPAGTPFKFVVRVLPGQDLRASNVGLAELAPLNGRRMLVTEFVKPGVKRVKNMPNMALVPLDSTSFGESSFTITPKASLHPGEYCFSSGKAQRDAYCFGVDPAPDVAGASPLPSASGGPGLKNADILKMVGAGLGPDVVISAIRGAGSASFDLTVDGLIDLKKNHVPDAVINAMQQKTTAVSAPPPAPPPPAGQQPAPTISDASIPAPPDEETFYYLNPSGRLSRLEFLHADFITLSELSHRNQTGYKVFGARSGTRFTNGAIVVIVKLPKANFIVDASNPADIHFRRWEPTAGARETWISKQRNNRYIQRQMDQGEFEFTTTKIGDRVYKITPNEPLIPGEYCLTALSHEKASCFGIDPSH